MIDPDKVMMEIDAECAELSKNGTDITYVMLHRHEQMMMLVYAMAHERNVWVREADRHRRDAVHHARAALN